MLRALSFALALLGLLLVASPAASDELPDNRWEWETGDAGIPTTTQAWLEDEVENPVGSHFASDVGDRPIGRADPYWPEPCNVICGYEVFEKDGQEPGAPVGLTHAEGSCGVPGQGQRVIEYPWGMLRVWYCEC